MLYLSFNLTDYCRDLESVTGTQCCSGGSCCQPATDTSPRCCCDELCFHYGDCCLDILDTGCNPPAGKNLPGTERPLLYIAMHDFLHLIQIFVEYIHLSTLVHLKV